MKVSVPITNVATGETRTYVTEWTANPTDDDPASTIVWAWDEGNYGCDCNRSDCFDRAGGIEPREDDAACSEGRFRVDFVEIDGVRHELPEEARRHAPGITGTP